MKNPQMPKDPLLQARHKAMRELAFHLGKSQVPGMMGRHPRIVGPTGGHRMRKRMRKGQQEEDY